MKTWNNKNEKVLKTLFDKWFSDKEIALKMWKTEDSIRNKLKRLKLIRPLVIQKKPKILFFDIETAPMVVYSWWLFDQTIGINQIKKDWYIISWSAKWLWEDNIISSTVTPAESKKRDDKRVVKSLHKMINDADIVVAHNWDKFDIKKMNTRFIKHWLDEPTTYKTIDTLKIARRNFAVTSNKLDYLAKFLWIRRKIDTGWFGLWEECMMWVKKSLDLMSKYCDNDVVMLEEVYYKLRNYDKQHPNLGAYIDDGEYHCPRCLSTKLKWNWECVINSRTYQTARCECWAFLRWNKAVKRKTSNLLK